jgi:hypothetical protein
MVETDGDYRTSEPPDRCAPGMVSSAALRATIVSLTLAVSGSAASVAGANAKAILVLHTYGHEAPGRGPFDLALARTSVKPRMSP